MSETDHDNGVKAGFDHIYDLEDPRGYYETLQALDYSTPAHASRLFERCVAALGELRGRDSVTVLDLCCGYGVNAALLNHDVDLYTLYEHYAGEQVAGLDAEGMAALDRRYYRRRAEPVARVLGLDVAANALAYAEEVDLLEQGFSTNLERDAPDDALAEALSGVDLVTVTGGLSYIGERTFTQVLRHAESPPWVACYPLRTSDFSEVRGTLESFGLANRCWQAQTFRHRRFLDEEERQRVVEQVLSLGLDPQGHEADGYYHAELHLARPAAEDDAVPLSRLLRD